MGKPNARERILCAANRLFCRVGYSNVGINEIIKEADTAKASFYQHFPSKEALCEAWLLDVHDRSEGSRQDLVKDSSSASDKITIYFDQLATYLVNSDFRGCPYTNTSAMVDLSSEGVLEQIRNHKESIRDFFGEILRAEFSDLDSVRELANQIFVLYSGATTEAQNLRDLWPVKSAQRASLALLRQFEAS